MLLIIKVLMSSSLLLNYYWSIHYTIHYRYSDTVVLHDIDFNWNWLFIFTQALKCVSIFYILYNIQSCNVINRLLKIVLLKITRNMYDRNTVVLHY